MVALFLIFEKPPYCLLWWLYQFLVQSALHEFSLFSISLPAFVIFCLLDDSYSDRCRQYITIVLICLFLVITAFLHVSVGHMYVFFGKKNVYLGPVPIFKLSCLFFWCWVLSVCCISRTLSRYQIYCIQITSAI